MTKEEILNNIDLLDKELEKIEEYSHTMPMLEGWEYYSNHPKMKERHRLYQELKLIDDYILSDFDRLDKKCRMTIENFINCCRSGGFIDDDGFGYYATENQVSNIIVYPSDIISGRYRKDFKFICWYNK